MVRLLGCPLDRLEALAAAEAVVRLLTLIVGLVAQEAVHPLMVLWFWPSWSHELASFLLRQNQQPL